MSEEDLHNATIRSTEKSPVKNRATSQSIFDEISSLLSRAYVTDAETNTSGDFYGYVMYDNRLTVDQFKDLFQGRNTFISKVLGAGSNHHGTVLELYVDIPQVSDFLPRPNLNLLLDFLKRTRGQDHTTSASSAQSEKIINNLELKKIYKEFREVLEIITMYPKVYKYTEKNEYLGFGSACKVHMPWDEGNDIQTMGYGYFMELIGGKISLNTGTISEAINEVIRTNSADQGGQ